MSQGIKVNAGFDVGSQQPLDSRQWLSADEMKNADINIMPDPYFAINKEDHFLYIFSKSNSENESTGYFTKYTNDGGMSVWKGSEAERDALPEETKADESIIFYTWDVANDYKYVASKTVTVVENMSEADYQALETKDAGTIYTTPGNIRVGQESILSNFNWLAGKKINFLGDSITRGHIDNETAMDRPYPKNVAMLLNCVCNNYGISGSTLVDNSAPYSYQSFIDRMVNMDKDADVNVVMGGTNDFGHSQILLGNFSDTGSSTIYGALKTIAEYLITNFPNAINVFCAPIRFGSQNNGRYSMEELVYAVKSVAKSYGFVFIDTYHNLPGWMPQNATLLARYGVNGTDTTHPNQLFSDTIFGKYIAESILRLDGGNSLTPKDEPFVRMILDFANYYGGNWWSGVLKGWVEDNILHVNFNSCSLKQANGGASFSNGEQGWNNDEYKLKIPTTSGYVREWKLIYTTNSSNPVAFTYIGNGENQWIWQGVNTYTGTYPAGPIYTCVDIPLDR